MSQLMVPVFHANENTKGKAAFWVEWETAREMVDHFFAKWNKKANAINLLTSKPSMEPCALSLRMGPKVTEKAAEGCAYHAAIVEGWAWKGI